MLADGSDRARPTVHFGALALLLAMLSSVLGAEAEQPGKVYRIGFLGGTSAEAAPLRSLREGLRKFGYVQDKNIAFEYRFAQDKNERLPTLAAELVRSKVDVIVSHASPPTRAAMQATGTIPIVMVSVGDPVGTGFVASLARPGGNVTGLSNNDTGLAAKRLQLLKEALPKLSRVAVLKNPANTSTESQFRETESAARALAIEVQPVDVRDPKELELAFSVMAKARAGAFTVMGDPLFLSQQKRIADLALTKRLPSVFPRNENVEAGGLMSYGTNLADLYRQAAAYVDKILKGAKPGDLPVEEPTRVHLVINQKTAKALGITIPQELLRRADQVIE
jgi:putative tryptophan/tyrosine transport system substrate-binding protein